MTISLNRYVDIISGVGAGNVVPTRDLVGRFFTANDLLPPQTFVSFTTASEVASYFGYQSEEYARAVFYFSWISKNLTTPPSIQFARWANVAVAPMIFPVQNNGTVLANWTSITSGSFVLTMGGFTFTLSGLDFSAAVSLADVATIIEMAIQAEVGGGSLWTAATVTYSAAYGGFLLVGGATGNAAINVLVGGGGTDITPQGLLGWLPAASNINGVFLPGAIFAQGSDIETITETLTNSDNASNNFGSFAFLTNLNLTINDVVDAANWNNALNVKYLYSVPVLPANITAWQAALADIGGVGLTDSPSFTFEISGTIANNSNVVTGMTSNAGVVVGMPITGANIPANTIVTSLVSTTGLTLSNNATANATELLTFYALQFPEQMPMMIEAATDYTKVNSVQNYEFQQFAGITPSVTDDATANAYDAINVNYYGTTQTAGQSISFYQRGVLQGISTDIIDMNSYVNEIWLKDAAGAALMTLLLSLNQIAANNAGKSLILGALQAVINQAVINGTISVGKTLTAAQKAFITQYTNDQLAWYQVQNSGYWIDIVIKFISNQYVAVYTLVYSKDDVIRKIEGTHTLI